MMNSRRQGYKVKTLEELDRMIDERAAASVLPPRQLPVDIPQGPPRRIPSPATDAVNLPHHYAKHKIEPIRYNVENKFDGFQFNINKYTARAYDKHPTPHEDIKKVLRYAEMWLKFVSKDPDWWKPSTMKIEGYYP